MIKFVKNCLKILFQISILAINEREVDSQPRVPNLGNCMHSCKTESRIIPLITHLIFTVMEIKWFFLQCI